MLSMYFLLICANYRLCSKRCVAIMRIFDIGMDIKDRYAKLRRDLNKKIKAEIEKLTD